MIIIWLAWTSPIFQGASADYGVKSSGDILWEVRLHGCKTILSKTFKKESSLFSDSLLISGGSACLLLRQPRGLQCYVASETVEKAQMLRF